MGNCCENSHHEDSRVELQTSPNAVVNSIPGVRNDGFVNSVPIAPNSDLLKGKLAVAIYSLKSNDKTIMSFQKGDRLIILDASDPDWFFAQHLTYQTTGFIPRNYFAVDKNAASEEWFFDVITRTDAERLLMFSCYPRGTFLVRHSHIEGTYALSVKDHDDEKGDLLKHYKIRTLDNGGFFINGNVTFPSLQQLVAFYSEDANGICCKLMKPCPKPKPSMPGLSPDIRDEWEIPYSSLQFVHLLGTGNFGEVWYGLFNETLEVAIKCLKPGSLQSENFLQEVSVMKRIRHENIVSLYAVCTEQEPWSIVMEYLSHGSLLNYLKSEEGTTLNMISLVNMAAQIANAMRYIEGRQLIHRDLAARNILVGENCQVKLADFGLARLIEESVYLAKGGKVPVKWTAPEAYLKGQFTIKSDVWSYGVVLYELFSHGSIPYPGMKGSHAMQLITSEDYRMPKPDDPECSDAVYEVMLQCWHRDPEKRLTFDYIYHYFTDYFVSSEFSYLETDGLSLS